MSDINKCFRIDPPLDRRHTDFLLTVRHFAEPCGVILVLTFFAFSGLPMESGLLCSLVSGVQAKGKRQSAFQLILYGLQEQAP